MYKIGLSSSGKVLGPALFESYAKVGIAGMELSLGYEGSQTQDYKAVAQWAKDTGVTLWSFHLPFKPFDLIDISAFDPTLRKNSVAHLSELIKRAGDIGITKYILHSSGITKKETNLRGRMECAKESLPYLADAAESAGGVLCVENLPPICLASNTEEVKELTDVDSRLRVCFDTNHLLGEDPLHFIRALGDKIVTIHVSDYDFIFERHWMPGEGKIDWQSLYHALQDAGYDGLWLYEIGFAIPKTILRDRELNCEDFARNADEIFHNKPFTVLGRPNPELYLSQ